MLLITLGLFDFFLPVTITFESLFSPFKDTPASYSLRSLNKFYVEIFDLSNKLFELS